MDQKGTSPQGWKIQSCVWKRWVRRKTTFGLFVTNNDTLTNFEHIRIRLFSTNSPPFEFGSNSLKEDGLGSGWIRKESTRKDGKKDRQFISPDGRQFRSLKKAKEYEEKLLLHKHRSSSTDLGKDDESLKQEDYSVASSSEQSVVDLFNSDGDESSVSSEESSDISVGKDINSKRHQRSSTRSMQDLVDSDSDNGGDSYSCSDSDDDDNNNSFQAKSKGGQIGKKLFDCVESAAAAASSNSNGIKQPSSLPSKRCYSGRLPSAEDDSGEKKQRTQQNQGDKLMTPEAKTSAFNPYAPPRTSVFVPEDKAANKYQKYTEKDLKDEVALKEMRILALQKELEDLQRVQSGETQAEATFGKEFARELSSSSQSGVVDTNKSNIQGELSAAKINVGAGVGAVSGGAVSSGAVIGGGDGGDNEAASTSGGGWSPQLIESIVASKSPSKKSTEVSPVFIEVTHPFIDKNTGMMASLVIFPNLGRRGWHFRSTPIVQSFEAFLKQGIEGNIPKVYSAFKETFIRCSVFGKNAYHRRRAKSIEIGVMPYPTTKLMTLLSFNPKGFSLDVHVNKVQDNFRRLFSDGRVPAIFHLDYLKDEAPGLYNGFMAGLYRNGELKHTPYDSENALLKDFKDDFELTFKNGFARTTKNIHLNKYFTDYDIKSFLLSIGYNSFDEVGESDRAYIYKNNNFPNWDEIEEEPISG